jgi:hypothetical protein
VGIPARRRRLGRDDPARDRRTQAWRLTPVRCHSMVVRLRKGLTTCQGRNARHDTVIPARTTSFAMVRENDTTPAVAAA